MNLSVARLPALVGVRQHFPARRVPDFDRIMGRELAAAVSPLAPGARIAVAVGSRGIANLEAVVRAVIRRLQEAGARPFILPAMGSHGGASPDGQMALLADYGVSEAQLGVPFRPSMEVRAVGSAFPGVEVVASQEALDADGIVLVNRIKPHTDFAGSIGSGLLKMLVVGLGKQAGAARFHAAASRWGWERVLRAHACVLSTHLPLLAGVAILEDERHQTAHLEIVPAAQFEAREAELCAEARTLMPRLPFRDVDLLIVDQMGKNLSGTGMDPSVIGRLIHGYSLAEDAPHLEPRIRRLFVRDLTPESRGNAIGIGLADFTTARLVRAIDRAVTTVNSLTALSLQGAKIPLYFDTDREVIERATATLALPEPSQARIVRLRDTLSLDYLQVSTPLLPEISGRPGLELVGTPERLEFDAEGNLTPLTG